MDATASFVGIGPHAGPEGNVVELSPQKSLVLPAPARPSVATSCEQLKLLSGDRGPGTGDRQEQQHAGSAFTGPRSLVPGPWSRFVTAEGRGFASPASAFRYPGEAGIHFEFASSKWVPCHRTSMCCTG